MIMVESPIPCTKMVCAEPNSVKASAIIPNKLGATRFQIVQPTSIPIKINSTCIPYGGIVEFSGKKKPKKVNTTVIKTLI